MFNKNKKFKNLFSVREEVIPQPQGPVFDMGDEEESDIVALEEIKDKKYLPGEELLKRLQKLEEKTSSGSGKKKKKKCKKISDKRLLEQLDNIFKKL